MQLNLEFDKCSNDVVISQRRRLKCVSNKNTNCHAVSTVGCTGVSSEDVAIYLTTCVRAPETGSDAAPSPAGQLQKLNPTRWNKREHIWIFYFWFIEVIIYFFIARLLTREGKCYVFYMSLHQLYKMCKRN